MMAFEGMRGHTRLATIEAAARRFAADRSGAPAIEYAILAGAIAIAVVAAAAVMGDAIEGVYSSLNAVISG